jgi:hypothetical protein
MGAYVNLIEEIRNRLSVATGVGKDLESVKRISIGTVEEARKLNDFPIINVSLSSGDDSPKQLPHSFTSLFEVEVSLLVNKNANEVNTLYNTGNSTGPLFLFEKMLNTLDKDVSGNINLVFGGNANNLTGYTFNIDENNDIIVINAIMSVETSKFMAGGR